MDLAARTLNTLDWAPVREALVAATRTPMGAERARAIAPLPSRVRVLEAYALVEEITSAKLRHEAIPVDAVVDVRAELGRAVRGVVLDAAALRAVGGALAGLGVLHDWLASRKSPLLLAFAPVIRADEAVTDRLRTAFDADGTLADSAWPRLAELRRDVHRLRARVDEVFSSLLADEGWGEMLMDRYVTERDGRLVVPVKMQFRRGLGIVHGASASGETAFVEPGQTVEVQNDLREATDALDQETLRIFAELSALVARVAVPALAALEATGDLDLAAARSELGFRWNGCIPEVGDSGVIRLRLARHPGLALRGIEVVGNDLALDSAHRCLVLTGPNAGGKTIALKTVGLCACLARAAIPLPCAAGSRMDFFPTILADIGDLQSISGDLSTFSGHLTVLREALAVAGSGALILVDEVAVGTDPAQGAALATAVVEHLVGADARVVLTTHYPELKALPAPRILVGGMEFSEGRPTYRLTIGSSANSHALLIARRLGLPEAVLARAHELLDARAAALARLAAQLDAERERVARTERQLAARDSALVAKEAALVERERKLAAQLAGERERMLESARARLKGLEAELREMVQQIHAAPTLHGGNAALARIREARAGLDEAEAALSPAHVPALGERVWVQTVAQHGTVQALGSDSADVEVRGIRVRVPLSGLAPARGKEKSGASPRRTADRSATARAPTPDRSSAAVSRNVSANTCDLRGKRLADAEVEVEQFVSTLLGRGERFGFLLHGHGTGALKAGLRAWLPTLSSVRGFRPGEPTEGGDAFTVLEL